MDPHLISDCWSPVSTKIVFLIMDGLGGTTMEGKGGTELQVARTPTWINCRGLPLAVCWTPSARAYPGQRAAHFALFGYDRAVQHRREFWKRRGSTFPDREGLVARMNFRHRGCGGESGRPPGRPDLHRYQRARLPEDPPGSENRGGPESDRPDGEGTPGDFGIARGGSPRRNPGYGPGERRDPPAGSQGSGSRRAGDGRPGSGHPLPGGKNPGR